MYFALMISESMYTHEMSSLSEKICDHLLKKVIVPGLTKEAWDQAWELETITPTVQQVILEHITKKRNKLAQTIRTCLLASFFPTTDQPSAQVDLTAKVEWTTSPQLQAFLAECATRWKMAPQGLVEGAGLGLTKRTKAFLLSCVSFFVEHSFLNSNLLLAGRQVI